MKTSNKTFVHLHKGALHTGGDVQEARGAPFVYFLRSLLRSLSKPLRMNDVSFYLTSYSRKYRNIFINNEHFS